MLTQQEKFNSHVIQEMATLINRYLLWERFTLSFSFAEDDIFAFAESVLKDKLSADIERYVKSDPAATNASDPYDYVFSSYKGMRAVLCYRIANHLIYHSDALLQSGVDLYHDPFDEGEDNLNEAKNYFYLLARKISEDAVIETSIEINPSAKIERGLVIDHGFNTNIAGDGHKGHGIVIGETCEIGENCTILNGVTIGASDVNKGSQSGRRHPKIGSNVTICANVRVLGPIVIGDNVIISPFSVVTHDILSNYKVSIINQLQLEKLQKGENAGNQEKTDVFEEEILLYGIIPFENHLLIAGENLLNCNVCLCDLENLSEEISVDVLQSTMHTVEFALTNIAKLPENISICIQRGNTRIYILQPIAIRAIIRNEGKKNG